MIAGRPSSCFRFSTSPSRLFEMTASQEKRDEIMQKLEIVHNIKEETVNLEKMHGQLKSLVNFAEKESNLLRDYRKELEHLVQEKMSHVEELRLIHADINLLESTIKQAENERERQLDTARKLHEDFGARLSRVNQLRGILGLEQSMDSRDPHWQRELFETVESALISCEPSKLLKPSPMWGLDDRCITAAVSSAPFFLSDQMAVAAAAVSALPSSLTSLPPPPPPQTSIPPCSKPSVQPAPPLNLDRSNAPISGPGTGPPPAIRQQPPPMKSCLSCHQQIHRNAPICPLCKAKSRSRNPKKPKQKKPSVMNTSGGNSDSQPIPTTQNTVNDGGSSNV